LAKSKDLMNGLRELCKRLPEAEEYLMHGHPSFRAGKKCFLITSEDDSQPAGMSVKVPLMDQPLYCQDPRFTVTHYIGHHGWVTLDLSGGINWSEVERLVTASYRTAALKRMLKLLDG
jgi:predicted DNA-binding protein (MmcQ/YjbR family)